MEFDELSNRVIGCAIEVHRELGPGLLESTYEQCLAHELHLAGIAFKLQHPVPVHSEGSHNCLDGTVARFPVPPLRRRRMPEAGYMQPMSRRFRERQYMKLAGVKIGLLINSNVKLLRSGIKRFVLQQPSCSS